jgi:hypothetical protein
MTRPSPSVARALSLGVALAAALAAGGCGNDPLAALVPPTVSVTVTETFTGTLTRNGATSHSFTVTSTGGGEVQATLKTVSPDSAAVVGFGLGTWNGSSCQIVITNDRASQASALLGRATSTGSLCVRLFDVGLITDPQDYEIEVVHP